MATTGLEVFDKTLHTTNLWLDEINAEIGPDRHLAWHVLGAVLRTLRDEMQVEQSAHFAAQLPLLVRGAYFDQYRPAQQPATMRSQDEFMARIQHDLDGARPVKTEQAVAAVMRTLNRHVSEGQIRKVRDALPRSVRTMWPEPEAHGEETGRGGSSPSRQQAAPPPQHAAPPPDPAHAAPSRPPPQPSPNRPVREWEEVEKKGLEMRESERETTSPARSTSGSRAQPPIGDAGRPAGVQAAPADVPPAAGGGGRQPKPRTRQK